MINCYIQLQTRLKAKCTTCVYKTKTKTKKTNNLNYKITWKNSREWTPLSLSLIIDFYLYTHCCNLPTSHQSHHTVWTVSEIQPCFSLLFHLLFSSHFSSISHTSLLLLAVKERKKIWNKFKQTNKQTNKNWHHQIKISTNCSLWP